MPGIVRAMRDVVCSVAALLCCGLSLAQQSTATPQPQQIRTLRGEVLGAAAGERVRVAVWHGDVGAKVYTKVGETLAGDDGAFELGDVPWFRREVWGPHELLLIARSSKQVGLQRVIRGSDPGDALAITLRAQRTVRGRCVDRATGEPIAGVQVWPEIFYEGRDMRFWITGPVEPWTVATDADGRFELRGVPSGYSIKALAQGLEHSTTWLEIAPDDQQVKAALQPGGRIVGNVRGPNGEPMANVLVTARGEANLGNGYAFARTDQRGVFELRSLEAGPWSVSVAAPELLSEDVVGIAVGIGERVACDDVQVITGGVVVGRLLDAATGAPLDPGEQARVLSYGPTAGGACRGVSVAADGTFRLRLPPGRSLVYLTGAPGYQAGEKVLVVHGAETEVVWRLRPGAPPPPGRRR